MPVPLNPASLPVKPSVGVVGAPGLVGPLRAAGYNVLADGRTEASSVATAAKAEAAGGRPYVVVVGSVDGPTLAWLSVQVAAGRRVLGIAVSPDPGGLGVAGTRTMALPATLDEIMGAFGAPPVGGSAGAAVLWQPSDGTPGPSGDETAGAEDSAGPDRLIPFARPRAPDTARPSRGHQFGDHQHLEIVPERPQEPFDPFEEVPWPPEGPQGASGPYSYPTPPAPVSPGTPGLSGPVGFRPSPEPSPVAHEREVAPAPVAPVSPASPFFSPVPPAPAPDPIPPDLAAHIFGSAVADPPPHRSGHALASVLVSFSGKGAVGKTTTALAIAQRAASSGNKRLQKVVLVDANRGQGDLRKYLRVAGARLPSIYDAAISGSALAAIALPNQLNAARDQNQDDLDIAIVLAPNDDQADPRLVTADVYRSVITFAREFSDLVIIDTQIVEAWDTSGLIDNLVVPLLVAGAWGIGLADQSTPGFDNLMRRLAMFQRSGVGPDRLMVGLNRMRPDANISAANLRRAVEPFASFIGAVPDNPMIGASLDSASPPTSGPYAELVDAVLFRMTGLAEFAPPPVAPVSRSKLRPWRRGGR